MKSSSIKYIIFGLISLSLFDCRETTVKRNKVKQIDNFVGIALKAYKDRNSKYKIKGNDEIEYKNVTSLSFSEQSNNDVIMVYKTLFPENKNSEEILKSTSGKFDHNKIIHSLKMIMYTLGEMNLYYDQAKNAILNAKELKPENLWPYPLATSICHGGRIVYLIDEKKVSATNFIDILFSANKELLTPRTIASHNLKLEESKNEMKVHEMKVSASAVGEVIVNKMLNTEPVHYYMNIPFGGLGNKWFNKEISIGKDGYGIKSDKNKDPDLQFGHLYVRIDKIQKENLDYVSLLMGMEAEEPGYMGMFSTKKHDFLNALYNPIISVCGGQKWEEMKQEKKLDKVPNSLGGKVVFVNKIINTEIFHKVENFKDEELKKKVWWIILSSNVNQFQDFKNNYLQKYDEKSLKDKLDKIAVNKK